MCWLVQPPVPPHTGPAIISVGENKTFCHLISQAPGKIQATIYLALPISHKQAGTPGHPASQRMRTRSTGVQTTPTVIGRLDHQPKCRASLRDLKFSWVLFQEQEKILPFLQFTIIYLGVSTTRSLPKPDSPWGVGAGTHGPSASPPFLPGASGQQRRPPIFLSVWQDTLLSRLSLSHGCFAFSPQSSTAQPPGPVFAGKGLLGK